MVWYPWKEGGGLEGRGGEGSWARGGGAWGRHELPWYPVVRVEWRGLVQGRSLQRGATTLLLAGVGGTRVLELINT